MRIEKAEAFVEARENHNLEKLDMKNLNTTQKELDKLQTEFESAQAETTKPVLGVFARKLSSSNSSEPEAGAKKVRMVRRKVVENNDETTNEPKLPTFSKLKRKGIAVLP
jgi:hypothetical protein